MDKIEVEEMRDFSPKKLTKNKCNTTGNISQCKRIFCQINQRIFQQQQKKSFLKSFKTMCKQ